MTHKDILLSSTATFSLFCGVGVALDIALYEELLEMESDKKLQPVSK